MSQDAAMLVMCTVRIHVYFTVNKHAMMVVKHCTVVLTDGEICNK